MLVKKKLTGINACQFLFFSDPDLTFFDGTARYNEMQPNKEE